MRRCLFSLLLLSPLSASSTHAQTPASAFASRFSRLEKALEEKRVAAHAPGAGLIIVKDDRVLYWKGFGVKDLATKEPITQKTLFAIGSSTKAFTAMTVMMSQDDGKLKTSDSPRLYLPYFSLQDPEANTKMTIGDLLCHKSGLDRTDLFWYTGKLNKKEIIQNVAFCKPTAKFGEKFQYQNVMFLTAGEVVAEAQKTSWENYLKKRIFDPLEMKSSTLSMRQLKSSPDHAAGYQTSGDPKTDRVLPYHDLNAIAPAGAINSNLEDMAQWVRFLLNGGTVNGKRLVSEKGFQEIFTPHIDLAPKMAYGYGWFLREWQGHKVVEHGGNIDGFTAEVALMPDQHLGVVMLCNQNNSVLPPSALEIIWKSLLADPSEEQTPLNAVPSVKPEEEVGDYTYNSKFDLSITFKEGKLIAAAKGQPPFPLTPQGGRKYKLGDPAPDGFFLTFRPNAKDSKISEAFLEQPGVKLVLTKKGSEAEAAYKPPFTVEELHQKVIAALGGEAALRKHTALKMEMAIKMPTQGLAGKGIFAGKAPQLSMESSELFAMKKKIYSERDWCDGKAASTDLSFAPSPPKRGRSLANRILAADFYEPLDWKALYKTVKIKGEEKVGDETAFFVEKTPFSGDPITDYFSTKSFLLLKRLSVSVDDTEGVSQTLTKLYSDYRPVDGVFLPFHQVWASAAAESILDTIKVEWNPRLDQRIFEKHS